MKQKQSVHPPVEYIALIILCEMITKHSPNSSCSRIALIMEEAGELRSVVQSNKRQELIRLQEQMLERAEERAAMLEKERREDKDRIVRNQTEQYEV